MGTQLFEAGLDFGDPPEGWNVKRPERVQAVHRAYLEAGSRILLTNTFGGNRFRLAMHGLQDRVRELNRAAASTCGRLPMPTPTGWSSPATSARVGRFCAPCGTLEFGDAVEGFAEQAAALLDGGAD